MTYNILNKYKVEIYDKESGEKPFIKVNNNILSEDDGLCDSIKTERDALSFIIREMCRYRDKTEQMHHVLCSFAVDELQEELERKINELFDYEIKLNKKDRVNELMREKNLTAADMDLIMSLQ